MPALHIVARPARNRFPILLMHGPRAIAHPMQLLPPLLPRPAASSRVHVSEVLPRPTANFNTLAKF